MATYTIVQAKAKIEGYLDKVAKEAESYMKEYIHEHAKNATGKLEESINTVVLSEDSRSVGSSLDYAKYADQGRGEVLPVRKDALKWVYPRPSGDVFIRKQAGPAEGMHFIEETKKHLEHKHIPL